MMTANLIQKPLSSKPSRRPLRAIVEIIDGEFKVYPLSDSDDDERRILDALTFMREDFRQRA